MALSSMTGFGRADGTQGPLTWIVEVRSVNSRGLDVRLRVPAGFEALEPKIRERIQAAFTRGSISLTLTSKRTETSAGLRVNPDAIATVAHAVALMRAAIPGETHVNIDGLIGLRGVLTDGESEATDAEAEARTAAILASLDRALAELKSARRGEGQRLATALRSHINEIEQLVRVVAEAPSRSPEAILRRLQDQIARLTGALPHAPGAAQTNGPQTAAVDPDRLHQEAMLIATRIDIEEELTRLTAHVAAARELLDAAEPIGRKFDFLTQEFNREANTLCSKANGADITRAGLALKAVIDQMREQVQNIE